MRDYQDKYTQYHKMKCINKEPPGNDGLITTACADKLSLDYDWIAIFNMLQNSRINPPGLLPFNRLPGKQEPPLSRDCILGSVALGMVRWEIDFNGSWNFSPYPLPKFNLIKLIKQLWECKGKHRNHFWQNKLDQVYHVAFMVPFADRHYILSKSNKFNLLYWLVSLIDRALPSDSVSSRCIAWLKYGGDASCLLENYPEDHPIHIAAKKLLK